MTIFESAVSIDKPVQVVYGFLADMNNHQQLMPDNIVDWSSTTDGVSFTIQNISSLSLKIVSRMENEEIKMEPSSNPPFDMELKWILQQTGDVTEARFTIVAELNMMMKMFAAGPLQTLVDHETQTLREILN